MNKLKERIFGLIVVVALGVIFIPMLLENTQNPKSNVLQDVPAASIAKNDIDKVKKPEVLAELKSEKTAKPIVYDESQPIADQTEDSKAKQKAKLEEENAELAKAELAKVELAKAEQQKLEDIKQAKANAAKIEEDKRRQLEIEQAKAQQDKLEQEKRQREQAQLEQGKVEQAKVQQEKAEKSRAELAKLEQIKAEQAKFIEEKATLARAELAREEQSKVEQDKRRQVKIEPAKREKSHSDITKPATAQKKPVSKVAIKHGWVVQMGSFAEPSNASTLLNKLRKAGYAAFTRKVYRQGMDLTIVMVGPHANRADADRLCSTLSMKFQIDGIIVRYEPH